MNTSFNVYLGSNIIHVNKYGSGLHLLLVFHGFGESGVHYKDSMNLLKEEYTILIPDLPYHGQSIWEEGHLSKKRLLALVQQLLHQTGFTHFSLLGYSMGGRPALVLMQEAHHLIDQLVLVAPEGLRKNFWFDFSTRTYFGRKLFKIVMVNPGFILALIKVSRKMQFVSKGRAAYVEKLMRNTSQSKKVFQIWMCFREMKFRNPSDLFKRFSCPVLLMFGKHDSLVPAPNEREIEKWMPADVDILKDGHDLFSNEETEKLIYLFLKNN